MDRIGSTSYVLPIRLLYLFNTLLSRFTYLVSKYLGDSEILATYLFLFQMQNNDIK